MAKKLPQSQETTWLQASKPGGYTSEDRDYNGVEDMRRDVEVSMEKAMHTALQFSICDLCERDLTIHPDTIDAWNELVAKQ